MGSEIIIKSVSAKNDEGNILLKSAKNYKSGIAEVDGNIRQCMAKWRGKDAKNFITQANAIRNQAADIECGLYCLARSLNIAAIHLRNIQKVEKPNLEQYENIKFESTGRNKILIDGLDESFFNETTETNFNNICEILDGVTSMARESFNELCSMDDTCPCQEVINNLKSSIETKLKKLDESVYFFKSGLTNHINRAYNEDYIDFGQDRTVVLTSVNSDYHPEEATAEGDTGNVTEDSTKN